MCAEEGKEEGKRFWPSQDHLGNVNEREVGKIVKPISVKANVVVFMTMAKLRLSKTVKQKFSACMCRPT